MTIDTTEVEAKGYVIFVDQIKIFQSEIINALKDCI